MSLISMTSSAQPLPTELLHGQLKARLLEKIGSDWAVGARLPSILELSRQYGVGLQTAHRAVRELVEDGLLISRPRHGTFVLRTPQARQQSQPEEAQALLAGRRVCVHSTQGDAMDGMVREIANALQDVLRVTGCDVTTRPLRLNQPLEHSSADAMVVINPNSSSRIVSQPGQSLLVVSTAGHVPMGVVEGYDVVTVDQEQGAMIAGQRLRQAGCRSACFIGKHKQNDRQAYSEVSIMRLRGFEAGWGQAVPESHRLRSRYYAVDHGAAVAAEYLQLADRPEAVFAVSDELAVGFMLGLIPAGLVAGRDYSLVGFDGQHLGRTLQQGALSTIQVPAALMGQRGGELLIDRLLKPNQPVRRLSLGCSWFEGTTLVRHTSADGAV